MFLFDTEMSPVFPQHLKLICHQFHYYNFDLSYTSLNVTLQIKVPLKAKEVMTSSSYYICLKSDTKVNTYRALGKRTLMSHLKMWERHCIRNKHQTKWHFLWQTMHTFQVKKKNPRHSLVKNNCKKRQR